ncbi:MAG: hypothetical protein BEN19_04415 [Epulopiscium sp. Nuni2H_MBin003]|nr:MAG: hypothetical protein BEN19_04415 [Epulopiscium sp. Nuni2H_MBin003]
MEIRQLEYLVAAVEEKSFYRASERLFTSQPAISKSIASLERELDLNLFIRTSKGIEVTTQGEKLYYYAKNILCQMDMIKDIDKDFFVTRLSIASYPSAVIAKAIKKFYKDMENKYNHQMLANSKKYRRQFGIDYLEGGVQEIIDYVSTGVCEIGIIYISPNQKNAFNHILSHKHLEFIALKESQLCIYVGKKHPLYGSGKTVKMDQLPECKFVRGIRDFFSVEHHFDYVNLSDISTNQLKEIVVTNSDHLVTEMLNDTDLCYIAVNVDLKDNPSCVNIEDKEKNLVLGYIKKANVPLNNNTIKFLPYVTSVI